MATPSDFTQTQLCMEPGASTHTFDTSSEPYEFISFGLQARESTLQTDGTRGTRSRSAERLRGGLTVCDGPIVIHPSPADLDLLLPRILGAAEDMDTFALAETIPAFGVLIDESAETFEYSDCYVNRAIFRSSEGGLLELELDIWAKSFTIGTSYPSLSLGTAANDVPYTHYEAVTTLVSSARDCKRIEIEINNNLERSFNNNQTAQHIFPVDRNIFLRVQTPFTSGETGLDGQSVGGSTGTVVYTNGNMSTTFTFGTLDFPDRPPTVPGRGEIVWDLEMLALETGGTEELVVTHDSTA